MSTTVNSMCTKPSGLRLSKYPPATNEDQHKASTTQQVGSECTHEQQAGSKRAPAQHMRINRKQEKHNKQAACAHMSKKQGSTSKTANKEQATSQRTHTRMWGLRNETQSWTKKQEVSETDWAKTEQMHACATNEDQHKARTTQQTGSKCTQEQHTGSKCTPAQQIRINIKQEQHNRQGACAHMSIKQGSRTETAKYPCISDYHKPGVNAHWRHK